METRKNLIRRLNRLYEQEKVLKEKYNGNETMYTFHGGFEYGYVKGKIGELENQIEESYFEEREK